MSYLKEIEWELVPNNLPVVKRNCPKCNEKTNYINSEKFRVNANKNNIDVWLIYHCEKCKSTWNMEIYSRVNPTDIDSGKYKRFLANDSELAKEYGFNINAHNKNKSNLELSNTDFNVLKTEKSEKDLNEKKENDEMVIEIKSAYPCKIRLDKLLADNLNFSRNKIKMMFENGQIFLDDLSNIAKAKVKDKMKIHILY